MTRVIKIEPRKDGRYNLFWSDNTKTITDKNSVWLYESDLKGYEYE